MGEHDERRIRELTVAINGLADRLMALERRVERLMASGSSDRAGPAGAEGHEEELPAVNLDDARGNPKVAKQSPRWKGPRFEGKLFSECSPEFLRDHAAFLRWKASNPLRGKEQYAAYDRLDAARAIGWAERIEGGWRPPERKSSLPRPSGGFARPPGAGSTLPRRAAAADAPAAAAPPPDDDIPSDEFGGPGEDDDDVGPQRPLF